MTEDLAEKWMFAVTGARRCPRCGSITFKKKSGDDEKNYSEWQCTKCKYLEEKWN